MTVRARPAASPLRLSCTNPERSAVMDVFELRERLIRDYAEYVKGFISIRDRRIHAHVDSELAAGALWPDPLIQLNPSFARGEGVDQLVDAGVLHPECRRIFQAGKSDTCAQGTPIPLHRHQTDAIKVALTGGNYVVTTGTGSGKSLAYIIPIVDHLLRRGPGKGIQAIVVYPMNALANSQLRELTKFLCHGYPAGRPPVRFGRYTGQESEDDKNRIIGDPPDILLTNYVMLELILTRPLETRLVAAARGLGFLVLDELHTYRGRQGADVAMLVRRAREAFGAADLQCVGTSATLAGGGTFDEQQRQVAGVASLLFGAPVEPRHVIGESLTRATDELDFAEPAALAALRRRLTDPDARPPARYLAFVKDPLSSWLESTFGVIPESPGGRLVRCAPRSITGEHGAAKDLAALTGASEEACTRRIQEHLLAGYTCAADAPAGRPPFAFRLHQFVSRGERVYASIERQDTRHLTLNGQQFVPGDRSRLLLPLVFCRQCGQEYYCVSRDNGSPAKYVDRELGDRQETDSNQPGFLYVSSSDPWPTDASEVFDRLPDDWIEEGPGGPRLKRDYKDLLPRPVRVSAAGVDDPAGTNAHFFPTPFRFCLCCGVAYTAHRKDDFSKLATLSTEGRSSATTTLCLSAIRWLRSRSGLPPDARKLLSFTDNRQDASLQAGHFNDFVQVGLLRAALYRAASAAGAEGLAHDLLVLKVFEALDLPLEQYALNPKLKYQALEETKKALRSVLGYRLYGDLERGWRITLPNLEQCGLLKIRYRSLAEVCHDESVWKESDPALAGAAPDQRIKIAQTLLDEMRRGLALKVEYLEAERQERMAQESDQHLIAPWALDRRERGRTAAVLYPRSIGAKEHRGNVFLSGRSGFGRYLAREFDSSLKDSASRERVIRGLLAGLEVGGLVAVVDRPKDANAAPGYQVPAAAILWTAGDGRTPAPDPLRLPRAAEGGGRVNPFFLEFYRTTAHDLTGLHAKEHTAQVNSEVRQERERLFGAATLPILFCSPTMELGVDIKDLNVVSLRNVPPTPANYAQRSGRAGRSGQPALVFAYCSTFSSHDQYFFRRPHAMVGGVVRPPRIELANEDLIRAHIHAVWLAAAGVGLQSSLNQLLDVAGEEPTLALLPALRADLEDAAKRAQAQARARRILETLAPQLAGAGWWSDRWLDEAMNRIGREFDAACERWRRLYRAASEQRKIQNRVIGDASRGADEKQRAKELRAEAEAQLEILGADQRAVDSDFNSYRYFASEGFLPGYNFPRLPISAYIPGRVGGARRDDYVSRPRFLAIAEFGPRAVVYHEGSRYRIARVHLGPREEGSDPVLEEAKRCAGCGYLHPMHGGAGADRCESCGRELPAPLTSLFRMQNVYTRHTSRINSDEEERLRLGFEIVAAVRFAERDGREPCRKAMVRAGADVLAELTYADAATIWRINKGWRRRAAKERLGFVLDIDRGYWVADKQADPDDEDGDAPAAPRTKRVIPYVEDRRNALLFTPVGTFEAAPAATLQAALKTAIQRVYQLEDAELAAERLPDAGEPSQILLYEAAEGGAGVLRRLVDEPGALATVARQALDVCHFNPATGADRRRAEGSKEDCVAACYGCLMSYFNQQDHRLLDRHTVRDTLLRLAGAQVESSPGARSRADHLAMLLRQCQSDLERKWLRFLEARGLRLPSRAQVLMPECGTRPDFVYDDQMTVVYVDGPPHEFPERAARDREQAEKLEDAGWAVVRFGLENSWLELLVRNPALFGADPGGHSPMHVD